VKELEDLCGVVCTGVWEERWGRWNEGDSEESVLQLLPGVVP